MHPNIDRRVHDARGSGSGAEDFQPGAAFRRTINRIAAHVYELRLFLDEPSVVFRAQRELVRENLRLLWMLGRPCAILLVPFALIFVELNAFYGHIPIVVGEPAIVTMQLMGENSTAQLKAPPGVSVETPPVDVLSARQISWRIRPLRAVSGDLEVLMNGHRFKKKISAGNGIHYLSPRRQGSILAFLFDPVELPFANPAIAWIEIRYPTATIYGLPWAAWFVLSSAATTLAYPMFH